MDNLPGKYERLCVQIDLECPLTSKFALARSSNQYSMKASQLFVLSVVLLVTQPLTIPLLFDLSYPPTSLPNHSHPPLPHLQLLTKILIHKNSLVNRCLCGRENLSKPKTLALMPLTLGHHPNPMHKHMIFFNLMWAPLSC